MPGPGCDDGLSGVECCRVLVNEEAAISPTFAVFFRGCDCRCTFCLAMGFSHGGKRVVDPYALRRLLTAAPASGVKTVSFVGGEPSLYAAEIATAVRGLSLPPLVLNSNMLYPGRTWARIRGLFSFFIADLKFGNDDCALRLSGTARYWNRSTRNIVRAVGSSRVIVRHLVLPGHIECCTRPVLQWLAARGLETNLMLDYYPACAAGLCGPGGPGIKRHLEDRERRLALDIARRLGVRLAVMPDPEGWAAGCASRSSPAHDALPTGSLEIIIDPAGRLVIPDLPVELVDLVRRAAPASRPPLRRRRPPTPAP